MSDYNSVFTGEEIDSAISLMKNAGNVINGISLESGTDLNTLFTPGWYHGLGTNSFTNRPITSRNFVLCVFPSSDGSNTGNQVGQLFITTGSTSTASSSYPSALYVRGVRRTRSSTSGTYSYSTTGWTTLATSSDITSVNNRINAIEDTGLPTSFQYITFSGTGNPFTQSIKFDFTPTIIKMYKATTNSTDVKSLVSVHKVNPGTGAGITMIWGQGGGTFNSSNNTFSWSGGAGYYLAEAIR